MESRRRFEVPNHQKDSARPVRSHPYSLAFERCHSLEASFRDLRNLLEPGSNYGFRGWVHPSGIDDLADTPALSLLNWKNEAHLGETWVQGHRHTEGSRMQAMPERNWEFVFAEERNSRRIGRLEGDLCPTTALLANPVATNVISTYAAL